MSILSKSAPPNAIFDAGGLYRDLLNDLSETIRKTIIRKIERSNELRAYVGKSADAEVMKVFTRGIKVRFTDNVPARLEVEFKDELSHWYGGELPEEFMEVVNKLISAALEEEMVGI